MAVYKRVLLKLSGEALKFTAAPHEAVYDNIMPIFITSLDYMAYWLYSISFPGHLINDVV